MPMRSSSAASSVASTAVRVALVVGAAQIVGRRELRRLRAPQRRAVERLRDDIDVRSTTLIVSTTGAASTAPRPGRTSRIPARTSRREPAAARRRARAPRRSARGSARNACEDALLARRAAGDDCARECRAASCAITLCIASIHSGSVTTTRSSISGITANVRIDQPPSASRQAARTVWAAPKRVPRPAATTTAPQLVYGRINAYAPSRFGRAKIIRPATVCSTLVTTTSVSSPIRRRPCSTTIIVPSSR